MGWVIGVLLGVVVGIIVLLKLRPKRPKLREVHGPDYVMRVHYGEAYIPESEEETEWVTVNNKKMRVLERVDTKIGVVKVLERKNGKILILVDDDIVATFNEAEFESDFVL